MPARTEQGSPRRRLRTVRLVACAIAAAGVLGVAAESRRPTGEARLHEVARLGGEMGALAATEGAAFVGVGRTLEILDPGPGAGSRSIGRIGLPGRIEHASVSGERLWLALGTAGLEARGADPPFREGPLAAAAARTAVHAVAARNGFVYAIDETPDPAGAPGVALVRVFREEGRLLQEAGSLVLVDRRGDQRFDLALSGDHLYVALGTDGVVAVVDVARPDEPRHVGDVELGECVGCLQAIATHGDRLYAVYAGELVALDIADPARPTPAGRAVCPGSCFVGDVVADDRGAFVAGCNGLCVFDTGPDGSVAHRATLDGLAAEWLAPAGDRLVAAGGGGVHGIDVRDLDAPQRMWQAHVLASAPGPMAGNDITLLLAEGSRLRAFDLSAPHRPAPMGVVDLAADPAEASIGFIADLVVVGDAAFAAFGRGSGGRLVRLQLDGTVGPREEWSLTTARAPYRLAVGSRHAFLSDVDESGAGEAATLVIDIASAGAPRVLATIPSSGPVGLFQSWLVIATPLALEVYDVADPARPAKVAALDGVGGGADFLVDGPWLYQTCAACADPDTSLQVVDLSDGRAPRVVASLPGDHGTVRTRLGSWLLSGYGTTGLHVFDVSDPSRPVPAPGAGWTGGTVLDAVAAAGHVYVAGGWDGLVVLAPRDPGATATPTPGRSRRLWLPRAEP